MASVRSIASAVSPADGPARARLRLWLAEMAEWADGSAVLVRTLAHGLREWMALIGARVLLKK